VAAPGILAGVTSPPVALLVPPVRLGRLLREAREAHGETVPQLVRRSGLVYDEEWFGRLEAGRVALDEPLVRWVSELYGVGAGEIVPARSQLVIDLDEGAISIGGRRSPLLGPADAPVGADQLLGNYLALVYLLRDLPAGTPIPIREVDVAVLAQALQRSPRDVRTALGRLIAADGGELAGRSAALRHRLIVPVAGILVGLTAVGGLLLVRSTGSEAQSTDGPATEEGPAVTARDVPVDIGDAVVIERGGVQTTR
jgi:transcriptional regulator with XRE-family HTH domain